MRTAWDFAVQARTASVNAAIDDAENAITSFNAAKKAGLDARAKEIKWSISAIYEY